MKALQALVSFLLNVTGAILGLAALYLLALATYWSIVTDGATRQEIVQAIGLPLALYFGGLACLWIGNRLFNSKNATLKKSQLWVGAWPFDNDMEPDYSAATGKLVMDKSKGTVEFVAAGGKKEFSASLGELQSVNFLRGGKQLHVRLDAGSKTVTLWLNDNGNLNPGLLKRWLSEAGYKVEVSGIATAPQVVLFGLVSPLVIMVLAAIAGKFLK